MLDACKKVIDCFIRTVYWIPVLFVLAVIVWGYVVYVYVMNISDPFPEEDKVPPSVKVLRLIGAHIILTLHLSSFLRAIFTNHKEVPVQYHVTDEQLERLEEMVDGQPLLQEIASGLPISTMTRSGSVRYCDRCEVVKPDRCHHCSICDRCVLKMDHHCPWVNNCVGYSNYKYFVLFLFYTVVTSLYVCLTGLYDFTQAWNGTLDDNRAAKFNIIFCFFVSAMFGFSTSFLFFFHIYLVLVNKTTLENMKSPIVAGGPDRRYFNIGFKRNIKAVFGKNCLLAFLPIDTSEGDGLSFSHRHGSRGGLEVGDRTSPPGDGGQAVRNLDGDGGDQTTSGEESEIEIFAADTTAETQPLTQRTTEL